MFIAEPVGVSILRATNSIAKTASGYKKNDSGKRTLGVELQGRSAMLAPSGAADLSSKVKLYLKL